MQVLRSCLLLLFLPGFVLGPGWSLRICAHDVLGSTDCCEPESGPSCCADEERAPGDVVTEVPASARPCDVCCIDIATSVEPSAAHRGPERLAEEWKRAPASALSVSVPTPAPGADAPAALPPTRPPPAAPGRCTPLPLRL